MNSPSSRDLPRSRPWVVVVMLIKEYINVNSAIFSKRAQKRDQIGLLLVGEPDLETPIVELHHIPQRSGRAVFFIGINDPLGQNPTGAPFTSEVYDLYSKWSHRHGGGDRSERRQASHAARSCSTPQLSTSSVLLD
jgi:hypothetical protein